MLQKGFLRSRLIEKNKIDRKVGIITNIFFYMGILLSILCLGYMIVNIQRADEIIGIWLPFMLAGPVLIFLSRLVKWL